MHGVESAADTRFFAFGFGRLRGHILVTDAFDFSLDPCIEIHGLLDIDHVASSERKPG